MKKQIFLPFLILIALAFSNIANVSASALSGASCVVTARVIDKGTETRKAYGPDGKVSREYESKFLKVEILTTKRSGVFGNCDFTNKGDVFKIVGGSNPDPLNVGDTIEAGLEASSAMTPSGVASSFIQWEPVSLMSSEKSLPPAFHLQSSNKPEVAMKQTNDVADNVDDEDGLVENRGADDIDADVVADNKALTEDNDASSGQNGLIIVLTIGVIIVVGGTIYLLSRQRKT